MTTLQQLVDLARAELDLPAGLAQGDWPTDRSLKDLGIDSLSFMEFVFRMEDVFGVSIPEDTLKPDMDLGQLAALIDDLKSGGKLSAQGGAAAE